MSAMRETPIRRGTRTDAPAADEDAALPLGQRVIGRALGNTEMSGASQFEATADDCALQYRDHRDAPELDMLECAMPHHRMGDTLDSAALGEF